MSVSHRNFHSRRCYTAKNVLITVYTVQNHLARGTTSVVKTGSWSAQHGTCQSGRNSNASDADQSTELHDVFMKDTKADSIIIFLDIVLSAITERMTHNCETDLLLLQKKHLYEFLHLEYSIL